MTLRWLVFISSLGYVLALAVLVCLRIRYPFELEWLEGASVDHVRTILSGKPLYGPPSLQFTPLTYTPGYFYLAAGLSTLVGVGFVPLRVISIVSVTGLMAVTFRLVWREVDDAHAGLLAVGLFAAMYGWTSGWLDLARTDSLFLFLTMLAIYILRWYDSAPAVIAAAVVISLAFLTKQTALIVAIPVSICCLLKGWRALLVFAVTVALIVGGTSIAFDRFFHGWYVYYVFSVPKQHPLQLQSLYGFWRHDTLVVLPIAMAVSMAYLVWKLAGRDDRKRGLFYLCAAAGCFAGAWVSRLHSLSFVNVVLPAYLITSAIFAIAVYETIRSSEASGGRAAQYIGPAVYALCLLQLARVVYWPSRLVPTAQDVASGRLLVQRIADTPGEVFLPYHGYLPALAGKETHTHAAILADVIRGGRTQVERRAADELADALRTHRFSAVIMVDSPTPVRAWLPVELYYRPAERLVSRSRFWSPEILYLPH
jgi:Dolichyl-phosphate-mannose-protein mannosyltransferase